MTESEFESERADRIKRIMAKYEKKPYVREPHVHKPLTAAELKYFKAMGCEVTIVKDKNQQTLF